MQPWLEMAKKLQAIAQAGHAYSKDKFDLERFDQVQDIAFQMIADLAGTDVDKIEQLYINETGYPTPKIDVRGAVFKDGKILLVKEREDGKWTLPGGWGDVCETPTQGVMREVREESGYEVANPRLVAIKDRAVHGYHPLFTFHIYKLFFLCDFISGEAKENIEISDIGFFGRDEIPELSESRTLPKDIEMMFEHFNDPTLDVYVD
ncbi:MULTISPECIES: NUDIX hydrolase [Vibrio]|uniref:NUDIX domain-containing protein n=2 Tax=Vibrio TaxID=662 RepID=A0A7X4LNP7_9VIBR|nr:MULTISPECIES: NUDIX hydrolase [Vibrio]MBF9002517.1 NUDIX hydrolase [Vibrio nitrifigilis]MZI95338.1 NUDIX domain-containing protein [Vibrio eleionomae]